MKYSKVINTKIGKITLVEEDNAIIEMCINHETKLKTTSKETKLLEEAKNQLEEYLARKRKVFSVPLNPQGTDFMRKVWTTLKEIPYGEVKTYGQIAKEIGNPKAARAVGMANHKNPIPIFIPCHRIIGSNNKLVGYALGIELKQNLLKLEGVNLNDI